MPMFRFRNINRETGNVYDKMRDKMDRRYQRKKQTTHAAAAAAQTAAE